MNAKPTHKAVRVNDLMYKGCEPHWKCTICGLCLPFHLVTKEQFEAIPCAGHKKGATIK